MARRRSDAGFEALLEPRLILRDLLPRLPHRERRDELPPAVPLQVELERDPRAGSPIERIDPDRADRPHRAVQAAERGPSRRLVLGDFIPDVALPARDAPDVRDAGADPCRSFRLDPGLHDRALPLAVPVELV